MSKNSNQKERGKKKERERHLPTIISSFPSVSIVFSYSFQINYYDSFPQTKLNPN